MLATEYTPRPQNMRHGPDKGSGIPLAGVTGCIRSHNRYRTCEAYDTQYTPSPPSALTPLKVAGDLSGVDADMDKP